VTNGFYATRPALIALCL